MQISPFPLPPPPHTYTQKTGSTAHSPRRSTDLRGRSAGKNNRPGGDRLTEHPENGPPGAGEVPHLRAREAGTPPLTLTVTVTLVLTLTLSLLAAVSPVAVGAAAVGAAAAAVDAVHHRHLRITAWSFFSTF